MTISEIPAFSMNISVRIACVSLALSFVYLGEDPSNHGIRPSWTKSDDLKFKNPIESRKCRVISDEGDDVNPCEQKHKDSINIKRMAKDHCSQIKKVYYE